MRENRQGDWVLLRMPSAETGSHGTAVSENETDVMVENVYCT